MQGDQDEQVNLDEEDEGSNGDENVPNIDVDAEILGDKYQGKIPLPRIPTYQATDNTAY